MIARSPLPTKTSSVTSAGYGITLFAITVCIVWVWLTTTASRFADFDTYVLYLDQLVHFPPANWWYFEVLSNAYLLSLHNLTRSVEGAIVVAHYMLAIIFVAMVVVVFPPRRSSWMSVLFFFCLLGPVLAFVTLRATPAYFLIAIACFHAMQRQPKTWLYVAVAFLFHASTLLAVMPLLLLYNQDRLPQLLRGMHLGRTVVLAVLLIPLLFFLPRIAASAVTILQNTAYLSKYIAYTDEALPSDHVTSANHYIFLGFVLLFTLLFMARLEVDKRRINIYVMSSLVIYIISFFALSPVAAFRQTPFFLLPMVSLFPWHAVGIRGPATVLFAFACLALFFFQFYQVYI